MIATEIKCVEIPYSHFVPKKFPHDKIFCGFKNSSSVTAAVRKLHAVNTQRY